MLKLGVIHKLHINKATDWVHNLVLVRKPSDKLHVSLDPQTIKKSLRFNIHNAKTFPEITSKINDVMYVSKIDPNSGFWTLPMDPESQILTSFNMPWGRFCFLKMPSGLNQSQYFFQFRMDTYFGDLNEGAHVIADDVKIHGKNEATHDQSMQKSRTEVKCREVCFQSQIYTILWSCNFWSRCKTTSCQNGHYQEHVNYNIQAWTFGFSRPVQLFVNLCTRPELHFTNITQINQEKCQFLLEQSVWLPVSMSQILYLAECPHIVLLWSRPPCFPGNWCESI